MTHKTHERTGTQDSNIKTHET